MLLEDRRIRLNAWASKILQIPVQKIKKNKFVNPRTTKKELRDPKNLNFTLNRTKPLTALKKKEDITFVNPIKIFLTVTRLPLTSLCLLWTRPNTRKMRKIS